MNTKKDSTENTGFENLSLNKSKKERFSLDIMNYVKNEKELFSITEEIREKISPELNNKLNNEENYYKKFLSLVLE